MPEKYQQEIEEILNQVSNLSRQRPRQAKPSLLRAVLGGLGRFLGGRGWSLSPGRIMLGAFILLLLAWWFRSSMGGLAGLMAWAAVLLFILGYAFFFITPRTTHEKRWRGRLVATTTPWWERLRRWSRGR